MKANIASRLQTETPLLRDLITGLKKGEIKVPKFQRRFIWREDQALNLLDSIASNYPVGSLLLWKTQGKLAAERDIGEFSLPKTDDLTPTEYVLDGQQRLTVIYSCLGAPREEKGFQVAYDLISDTFIRKPSTHQAHIFPLRLLYDTTQLLNFRVGLVSHPDGGALQSRLDQLIEVLTNYRIPVVILKDLTVEEVCPIFERINSSGTRLSTYDLMVAATWSETFDLNDETQAISTSLQVKGFGDIEGDTVLKCLSAVQYTGVKKDQVLSLRKLSREQMDILVEKVREALLKTVDLLSTEFRVYSWDFLPYEALAVVLAYIFVKRQTLSAEDTKRVRRWFWLSAFSARYRGASDTFISKDLEAIDAYVVNSTEPDVSFGSAPPVEAIEKLPFQSRNSLARAFVLLLALHNPKNLTNGVRIDTEEALSIFNKKEFHHIFPQGYLKSQAAHGEHNSVANICMLSASENKDISDSDPHDYLPRLTASHGDEARAIFESNLLPDPTTFPYDVIPYEQFLKKRSEMLYAKILRLCKGGTI
jgi:hypothetical protein